VSSATTSSSSDGDDDSDSNDATDTASSSTALGTTVIKTGHGLDGKTVTIVSHNDDLPRFDHHGWHGSATFLVILGMILLAGIVRTAIRARHGDMRTNRQRKRDERTGLTQPNLTATRENELLAQENERLKAQAIRLEDRVAVLERIVTDPAKRVSDEIDALR